MEELGRDLLELVREATDLPYEECKRTLSAVVARMGSALSGVGELRQLSQALEEDLLDVEECGDAQRLKELHKFLARLAQDSQERSWALHEDGKAVLEALQLLGDVWRKAEPRVPLHLLRSAQYEPFAQLAQLYQMETRAPVKAQLLSVLHIGLELGPEVPDFALSTMLPATLGRELVEERPAKPLPILRLLSRLFATAAPPPYTHYDVLGRDFLRALLDLGEAEDDDVSIAAHEAVISFSLHFPAEDASSLLVDALESVGGGRQRLSENIVSLLNRGEDPVWRYAGAKAPYPSSVLEFLLRLTASESLPDLLFYSADAGVLVQVLLRQATDSGPSLRRTATLRLIAALVKSTSWFSSNPDNLQQLAQHLGHEENLPASDNAHIRDFLNP